jgi:NADH-quinone oxidoreductase subunit N
MNVIILSALWGVVMMFGGIFLKHKSASGVLAILGILVLLTANLLEFYNAWSIHVEVKGMLKFSSYGLAFNTVVLVSMLLFFLLGDEEIERVGSYPPEYYALIFFVLCGVGIASSFNTLLMLFLGIEIISIPLYILAGSDKRNLKSNEASLKYFLMGSFSTGIMLMGIAFLYGATGSFFVDGMNLRSAELVPMVAIGIVLLMISLAFKVSAAPFHFWTPDVYDGSPTVFTSFMATIVKIGAFIAFLRLFDNAFHASHADWQLLIVIITAATLLIGNITAVFQQSVKRMLAYSSIAHAGFMMFSLFALNTFAKEGLILYSAAYSLATIGIFAILTKMKDYTFDGFNGLAKKDPALALMNTIFLLSLTGIPLTAGFMAKYYMLIGAIRNGHYGWLVIFAVLMAAVSAYYYFRLIQAMYFKEGPAEMLTVSRRFRIVLALTALLIIILGIYPGILTSLLYY